MPQIGSLATVAYGRSGEPILVGLVGVVGLVPAIVSVAWGTAAAGIGHQGIGGTLDSGCVSVSTYCLNP